MRSSVSKLTIPLALWIIALSSSLTSQSLPFVGEWQSPDWSSPSSLGMKVRILQSEDGFSGSLYFHDWQEHEIKMLNPRTKSGTFLFDMDDPSMPQIQSFSMTVEKGGATAMLDGWGEGESFRLLLVKQP